MPRPKGKKGRENLLVAEKQKALQKYWDVFQAECEEFETRINSACNEACGKIQKLYADQLKKLPEHIRNMTLEQYLAMQKAEAEAEAEEIQKETLVKDSLLACRSQYEKSKLDSEMKRTLKKQRTERKRSLSASICSGKKLTNMSRVMSESCLNTPLSKRSMAPTCVVTPKFNPRVPLSKICLRKPRAGEVVMSLSGSPLHNFIDDIAQKPGVAVSLGGGKVINITGDTEIAKLDDEFLKKLDEETKSTLASVKQKLDMILDSK